MASFQTKLDELSNVDLFDEDGFHSYVLASQKLDQLKAFEASMMSSTIYTILRATPVVDRDGSGVRSIGAQHRAAKSVQRHFLRQQSLLEQAAAEPLGAYAAFLRHYVEDGGINNSTKGMTLNKDKKPARRGRAS